MPIVNNQEPEHMVDEEPIVNSENEEAEAEDVEVVKLDPKSKWFDDNTISRRVTRAFKAGYKYPYLNWSETPSYVRDAWFIILKGYCEWSPDLNDAVRGGFDSTCRKRLKDSCYLAGKKGKDGKYKCPHWMTPPVFKHFLERRKEKPFLKRSKQTKANKKCAGEGPSHHFGSISASQHAAKMMKRTGKLPTAVELFLEGHSKLVDGTRILSTQKHQEVYEAFQARRRDMAADLGEIYNDEVDDQVLNDNDIFLNASRGFKKGQVWPWDGSEVVL